MQGLFKVLSLNNNIKVDFKSAILLVLLCVFSFGVFGQDCNNLSVSLGPNVEYCTGANVTLTATITGGPTGVGSPIFTWEFNPNGPNNTTTIQGATGSSYTIPSFNNNLEGTYIVTVTYDGSNCDYSDEIDVDLPNNNISLDAGNNITICQGATVNINSDISDVPNGGTVTYSWSSNTGGYTSTSADPSFSNLPVGQYVFTGIATANGCTDNDPINVTVNAVPSTPTFSIPSTGCPGTTVPITGFNPVPGITYNWSPSVNNGNSSTPSITFNNGGTFNYSVTATNSTTGCTSAVSSQTIAITNVSVGNPSNVQVAGSSLVSNTYGGVLTYTLCGSSSGANTAQINYGIASNNTASYTIAIGNQAPITLTTGLNTIPVTLSIGNNFFTITATLNGCVVSRTFNIYAGSNPYVAGGVSNSVGLCTGQVVDITISTVNPSTNTPNATGTTYTLSISDNSSPIVNTDIAGNLTITHTFNTSSCGQSQIGLFPANTFYATIVASNACGTTSSSVSPIVVSMEPSANFNLSATTICVNSSVTITNTGISGNAVSGVNNAAPFTCSSSGSFYYTISPPTGWTVPSGTIGLPGFTIDDWANVQAASNSVPVNFNSPGIYTITQHYLNGCGDSTLQKTICVIPPPTCAFTANPNNTCTPLVTTITNNTTGPSCGNTPIALAYNWTVSNPVGGTSSIATATAVNPTITLNNNTVAPNLAALNFPITLVVNPLIPGTSTPVPNCSSTCNQTVTVYPQPSFITQPAQPPTVCLDGTFNALSVTVSYLGPGLPSYQWYSNINPVSSGGVIIPGATSSSYVPPATIVGTIFYYCVVTFPSSTLCSTITSNNVAAIVVPDPVASASPITQTICVGGTVPNALTGAFTFGIGDPTYQWNLVGTPTQAISGATASTYTPPAFASTGTFNYTVTINTSGSGCMASTSAQISVVVVPDPTTSFPLATQTLCQNATPTALTISALGGSGTLQYQWFSNTVNNTTSGTLISGATNSTYIPPTSTVGTLYYYCEVTTPVAGCSVTSAASTVIVIPAPTFTTQPTASNFCVGGTPAQMCVTYINGTGTPSYQWYTNSANTTAGATAITGATNSCYTPPATTAGTTYYYAIISLTGGGCSVITSNIAAVVITPDPTLTTQPTLTQTICVGGSSSPLTVALQTATGIGGFSYQWYSNTTASNSGGTLISGATSATYSPPTFSTAGTFYYYCIVTDAGNGCGTVTSQVATITVVVDPTITVQPLPTQTLCQNAAPTTLTVTASGGTGTLLYQWFSNSIDNTTGGTLIPGATASTYTPPTAAVGVIYYYCIVTTSASGCSVTSATGAVVVNPVPIFTIQPASSNVCVGGTTTQMCVTYSNGTGTPAYQWYSSVTNSTTGGTLISGATASCFTPPSTTAGTTYYYAIISLTGEGCSSITSNTASVVIIPDPIIATQPIATQTICEGGFSAPLSVSIQAATGIGAFTYQWFSNTTASTNGGASIANANAATFNPPVFNTAGTFYYYCVVTDAGNGCGTVTSQVATIIVVVDPTITVQPLPTQTLCQNAAPTALTVTASGGTGTLLYQWYSNTVNNSTSGTPIPAATNNTFSPPTANVGAFYYYCIVTTPASGCSVTSAIGTVVVNPAPTFTTQPTASNVCVGGTTNQMCVNYSNGTGTAAYEWFSNANNNTTTGSSISGATSSCYTPPSTTAGTTYYYAIITLTGGGCASITSNTAAVIITPDPILATQPTSTQSICVGGSSVPLNMELQAATGIGAFTYQWFSNTTASNTGGTSIANANAATFNPPAFNAAGTFYYYCVVTDAGNGCGTVASQVATIIVVVDPTITVQPLPTQTLCQNAAPTALTVTASGGTGTLAYQWYSNTVNNSTSGTAIPGATNNTYSAPTATVGTVYYYCIVTTPASGCSVTSTIGTVVVNPSPTFTTQPASSNVCVGGTTNQMCVTYSNGTGTPSYQWYSSATNSTTGGTLITGATASCFTPPAALTGTTYYYATITLTGGGCSSITSNTGEVIVNVNTSLSTQPTPSQTICVGGSIPSPLSVVYAGGVGTPAYQWFESPSNTPIVGANSSSFTPSAFSAIGISSYYVTVTLAGAGCGIQTSNIADITVVADPTATITSGASYCQNAGSVVPLSVAVSNGEGTSSYQWFSNTTSGNTTGTPIAGANASTYTPPVNQTGATYYYCVVTQSGANCAVNSPASLITVTPAPTFTTQPTPTQSVCVGGTTTQLNVAYSNGTGTATYQWYSNTTNAYAGGALIGGQTASSFTPPSAIFSTVYYYCIISFSADGGCSMINSNIAEVVVLPDPTISTQPLTTQTICVGGTVPSALNVAYTGGVGTPTYQWFFAPAVTPGGETNSSFTPSIFNSPGTYNYYVTIGLSGSGCDALTSANATVIVLADPIVSEQPTTAQSVCQNTATSQLSVSITGGTGTASYQWYSNTTNSDVGGTPIAGATLNTYTPPSTVVGTQFYYCTITQTGTNCGVTSNPAAVVVNLAPIFSNQPINTQQHCLNQPTNPLQVAYSNGTGTPTYQWYVNNNNTISGGTSINLATSNTYSPPSNIDGTFYYYCVVSFVSGGGCPSITSNISEVIIHPYPIVTITGGETICLLESSDINFAFTPSSGFYDITYTANGQSVTIDNYNGANPIYTVTPTQTTTYVVTNIAYDLVPQCAVQPNTSIVVIVNPLPALNNSNYTYCSDVTTTSLQYIPDLNSYTYNWLPNQSANYAGQINGPSSINVTLPDPLGNTPTDYYYVTSLTNDVTGCQALDSILVTINPNPVGSFALPTTGCVDSPIALSNGDATIGNYEWTIDGVLYSSIPNPAPPVFTTLGIHTIEMVAINSYGCTDTLNSVIQIYDLPVANFSTDINTGCAPLLVNFDNLSSGQFITNYEWTFAPDTVSWSNTFNSSSLINPPSVTYLQGDVTTTYTATLAVTNACGTVTSNEQITVLPTPVANFTLATHIICSGSTLMVNNISVGEPTGYTWTYGNFTSYNPNLNSMFFPSDSVTQVYPITLTLTNGCGTDTFNDSITVLPDNVQGGFTTTAEVGCSPLTVTFTNTTFDTNLSATWHLDDPVNTVIANQNTIQFTYFAVNNTTQNYNPYLVVTDGCANDTIYSNISVFANPIPNIVASQINICAGSSIDFSGSITGGGTGFDYAWDFGGLGTSNTQNSTFAFPNGSAQGLNIPVTLVVSSPTNTASNCSNSVSTSIYVYNNPDLSAVSYNTTDGCSLLDVQVAYLPANLNTINWGDGSINTNNFHTYTNNSGAILTYNLDVTSSVTYPTLPNLVCTSTTTEPITVHPSPLPVIASSATNSCEEQLVNFSASTSNNQNLGVSYSWNIGNLTSSTAANTSFTFTTGSAAGTTYPIELTASQTTLGVTCSAIANATIVVYDTPDLTPLTFNTTSGCSNLNVVLSNLPAATNQINWGDGTINFVNTHGYLNNGAGLLSYPVVVTSTSSYSTIPQLNCIATSNQIVDVYPTPLPQIFASAINVCEGDDIDFIASTANSQNTGITYLWGFGTMGTSNSANTTMTFDVGNATGLLTQVGLTAFQNTSGTICSATVTDNVFVYDTPDLSSAIYSNVNSCSPLLVSITNLPTSTYLYNWGDGTTTSNANHIYLNQGTVPLAYNVTIDATTFYATLPMLSCNAVANQIVQVNPQPFAAFTLSPPESCLYVPVNTTLQNTSLNAIAPYVWNYDGVAHTTNSLNYIATFNTPGAHPVELIVSNQFGCTDSVSQDFIIHELPTVTLNAIDDDLCVGATTEFVIDGTGISTSTWDFGDGTVLNLLNPTSLVHYYSQPGVYSITAIVTNIYGCTDTVTFQNEVIIHPTPTASFITSSTSADIVYPYFEFYDFSVGATNYYWNFGDSNWSNDVNPTHTYNAEGNYLVELTVTNEYNCFDIATQIVNVEGIVVYIPNAFTPLDYNGVNDVFKPSFSSTEGIEFYEMIIYNRWGARIFQTNSIDEAWIGNSQENDPGDDNYYAQNDTYIYTVRYRKKARANDPQPDQIITGHVTIIR